MAANTFVGFLLFLFSPQSFYKCYTIFIRFVWIRTMNFLSLLYRKLLSGMSINVEYITPPNTSFGMRTILKQCYNNVLKMFCVLQNLIQASRCTVGAAASVPPKSISTGEWYAKWYDQPFPYELPLGSYSTFFSHFVSNRLAMPFMMTFYMLQTYC